MLEKKRKVRCLSPLFSLAPSLGARAEWFLQIADYFVSSSRCSPLQETGKTGFPSYLPSLSLLPTAPHFGSLDIMSIQYKGSLTLSAGGTYNSTCYAAYSGDLAIAELPFPLTIAFDPRRLCYFLEWDQVDSPLQIDGGSVKLVCDEVVLLDVKLGKGPFPPTRSGSYGSSMGRKGLWAKVCVDLKLVPSQSRLEKETAIEKEYERKKATLSVVYASACIPLLFFCSSDPLVAQTFSPLANPPTSASTHILEQLDLLAQPLQRLLVLSFQILCCPFCGVPLSRAVVHR